MSTRRASSVPSLGLPQRLLLLALAAGVTFAIAFLVHHGARSSAPARTASAPAPLNLPSSPPQVALPATAVPPPAMVRGGAR